MIPEDFVYNQIYKGALNGGASQNSALQNAVIGLDEYKKHKIASKVSKLIQGRIKQAISDTKKGG